MAATINWVIEWMQCYPQAEGQTDVVFQVGWRCNGVQVDGDKTYSGTVYSTQGVTYVAGSPYTAYQDLTEQQVLQWIWDAGVDKDSAEAAVTQQIAMQQNPPVISPPLPWATPQA
jgi:hypothetical protein